MTTTPPTIPMWLPIPSFILRSYATQHAINCAVYAWVVYIYIVYILYCIYIYIYIPCHPGRWGGFTPFPSQSPQCNGPPWCKRGVIMRATCVLF